MENYIVKNMEDVKQGESQVITKKPLSSIKYIVLGILEYKGGRQRYFMKKYHNVGSLIGYIRGQLQGNTYYKIVEMKIYKETDIVVDSNIDLLKVISKLKEYKEKEVNSQ